MGRSVNKVFLVGNIGSDPEVKQTSSSTLVKFRLATNESYKNRDGEMVERTEWHNIIVWGKGAEILSKFVSKGSRVHLEGSLQTQKWEDKNGNDRWTTEVKVNDFMLLDSKKDGGSSRGGGRSVSVSEDEDDGFDWGDE